VWLQELSGVCTLLAQGSASRADIQAYRTDLYSELEAAAKADEGGAGMRADWGPALGPTHPLVQLLRRQCLGAALVAR
jgi:hypothetical protein